MGCKTSFKRGFKCLNETDVRKQVPNGYNAIAKKKR